MHIRSRPAAAIIAALAGITCLATACSSPKSPAAKSPPTNPATLALAYSRCMRSHGVKDYPDPKISHNGGGTSIGMSVGRGGDLNPKSPTFQAAQRACRKLSPAGQAAQQPTAQDLAADVRFGACMRSHGFPSFPGPNGQGVFDLPGAINSQSSQFKSAESTCRSKTHAHQLAFRQNAPGGGPGGGS